MFTGSNWDVAQANGFTIIDNAIAKFEHAHPGVTVHYYSGIRKDDYSEWFSRKLLQEKNRIFSWCLEPFISLLPWA